MSKNPQLDLVRLTDADRADYQKQKANLESTVALAHSLRAFEEVQTYQKMLRQLDKYFIYKMQDPPPYVYPDAVNVEYLKDQFSDWLDPDDMYILEQTEGKFIVRKVSHGN